MKQQLPGILLAIGIISTLAFTVFEDNGKAGYTGSPGEPTCNTTNCHTGQQTNSMGGSVVISCPELPGWQYTPGTTYNIAVTVTQTGRSLFGLGFEALLENGQNAGTLIAGTDNQIKSKTILGVSRKNIVHELDGGATADSHTFNFTWTAPATDEGLVTFYCSGNAANGNGQKSGDYIYTTTQVVTPPPAAINENGVELTRINLYPNPAANFLHVEYELKKSSVIEMKIISTDAKYCEVVFRGLDQQGQRVHDIDVSSLATGVYMLQLSIDGIEQPGRLFRH